MTVDQELAYEAVVELLAHQFAFPVKWIDTQDVLLGEMGCLKVIEVGPSATLTTMAKRTVASRFRDHDEANCIHRELISTGQDISRVLFEDEEGAMAPPSITQAVSNSNARNQRQEATQPQVPASTNAIEPQNATMVVVASRKQPDIAISAQAILLALIAQKIKKPADEISVKDSIKTLASGRSTLENELMGDLESEFSGVQIPERAESMSLEELAGSIQSRFQGKLGIVSGRMIEKIVGGRLPMGFGLKVARAHLDQRWGLAEGRQDAVLLRAVHDMPSSRIPDEKTAHEFFDSIARQYLNSAGLPTEFEPARISLPTPITVQLNQHHDQISADLVDFDSDSNVRADVETQEALSDLRSHLDLWLNEHGEDYASGIQPVFDYRKARLLDSAWAWRLQRVLSLFHSIVSGQEPSLSILRRVARDQDPKIRQVLEHLRTVCVKSPNSSFAYQRAQDVIESILEKHCTYPNRGQPATVPSALHPLKIKRLEHGRWQLDKNATAVLLEAQSMIRDSTVAFDQRNVLLTGAGPGSIGVEVLKGLLDGGARVVVTTSSYSPETVAFFRDIYITHCVSSSQLVIVPFNQGSQQDIQSLVSWIYDKDGLAWDLDAVIPFAALSENGREIDSIDSKSELAHRVMLTNTIRLIGAIKTEKVAAGYHNRPAQVILPLSANQGLLGGDGLYGESKAGLETLFKKWNSESWNNYLSIAGAGIGWTRGTGLMKNNDGLVQAIQEETGLNTFSQSEMAVNILSLLHQDMVEIMETYPIYADFHGGLDSVQELSSVFRRQHELLSEQNKIRAEIAREDALEDNSPMAVEEKSLYPRANLKLPFPRLPDCSTELEPLSPLQDMVNLDTVVVIAGFSELGPWGNARTRWEMESRGTFTLEGWVEMAWITGHIKHSSLSASQAFDEHIGWVDAQSCTPVEEHEIELKYGDLILKHSGIRLVEPALWGGYDPDNKEFFQEVMIESDLAPFEASEETALALKKRHGLAVEIRNSKAYIKKGAVILVPKAMKINHNVAGQIPTGWDPRTYGIAEDIISQVDRITLYTLICVIEALFSAGITDPYDIYRYIHTSEVGNCIGTGVGGVGSVSKMYKGRSMEQYDIPNDILQETFLNTPAAWVNMLLLSSTGPIKTPVGACATALESLDTAHDLILNKKAKICFVGGVDDLEEHMAYEFANMKATNNNDVDAEHGRSPDEMSRPTASDRRGFIESHGCGIQIVCTAQLALEMGLPVYGIVAFSGTSSDKIGRSIPAPGKGVMVNVRERQTAYPSPLLDLKYRRRQISLRRKLVQNTTESELAQLAEEMKTMDPLKLESSQYEGRRTQEIQNAADIQRSDILRSLGSEFWHRNPEIAPIRGALAVWGLTVDDLNVASFHGTSTVKNELNECEVMQRQLVQLGRTPGNRVLGVFQKHLTGHPKGAAGAWMLNGCLQMLDTGLVPGNSHADNIDPKLEEFDHIAFLNKPIQTADISAASVFSFGFGQKGTQVIVVHPKYLFATLQKEKYDAYRVKTSSRRRHANVEFQRRMLTGELFKAKDVPPYEDKKEYSALIDPDYRFDRSG